QVRRRVRPAREGAGRRRPRVAPGPPDDRTSGGECMKLTKVGALAATALFACAPCNSAGSSTAPSAGASAGASSAAGGDTSKGTVNIAIELPQQGSELAPAEPIINCLHV